MNPEQVIPYVLLAALLFLAELLYFRIAMKLHIIDKPNERSSHVKPVIRGGGVIFVIALWMWFFYEGMPWPQFIIGVTVLGIVSFIDDVFSQPAITRFSVHLAAVLLVFCQVPVLSWPLWFLSLALIVCIGTLNAFNFMDGINGITGVYALVSLGTFLYIDQYVFSFTLPSFVLTSIIAVLIFLFFNFRKKAHCFAGDIGSVTIAFVQVFLLLQLIFKTGNFAWVLLFLVFGVDSVVSIIYRMRNGENIFKPHRTHLYQYISNELKVPQLWVSVLYGLTQLSVNVVVIRYCENVDAFTAAILLMYALLYGFIREIILKHLQQPGLFQNALLQDKFKD